MWEEFPTGPEGLFLKRGSGHASLFREVVHLSAAGVAVHLAVRHQRFPGVSRAADDREFCVRLRIPGARSHPVAALIFAFAFVFVSLAPVYMVQIAPDFFNFAVVLFAFFFWCYKEVARPGAGRSRRDRGARAGCWRPAPTRSPPRCSAWRCSPNRRRSMLIAPLLVSALLRRQWWRLAQDRRRCLAALRSALFAGQHRRDRRMELPGRRSQDVLRRRRRHFQRRLSVPDRPRHVRHGGPRPRRRRRADRCAADARRAARSVPAQPRLLPVRPSHRICRSTSSPG